MELEALTPEEQTAIRRMNRREDRSLLVADRYGQLAAPRTQIDGEPRLMQWPLSECLCPVCECSMPLLASIGNENGCAPGFTDNDFIQTLFFLCDGCTVVTAYNLCN
jgi:hypothetical protein